MNNTLTEQQNIISVLTNFNFTFKSFDEEKFIKDLSVIEIDIKEYLSLGWREKLIASFYVCFFNKQEYKELISGLFFEEFNGKQLKGYILVIMTFFKKEFALDILDRFLELHPNSIQIDWIYAAKESLERKLNYNKDYEKKFQKIHKAFNIIQKYQ